MRPAAMPNIPKQAEPDPDIRASRHSGCCAMQLAVAATSGAIDFAGRFQVVVLRGDEMNDIGRIGAATREMPRTTAP